MWRSIPTPHTNMKVLLLSCKKFNSKIKKLATRPESIKPEPIKQNDYTTGKSIVALITAEAGDDLKKSSDELRDEIEKFSKDTGINEIVIFPFGHLSNKLASSEETVSFLDLIESKLQGFKITRVHFGSHKSLLLDIYF